MNNVLEHIVRCRRLPAVFLLCATIPFVAIACDTPAVATESSDAVRMNGDFTWTMGGEQPTSISAVLSPTTTPNEWKVVFRFRFNGARHRWEGELTHNPTNASDDPFTSGSVTGIVSNGGRRSRTWRIEGNVENGQLTAQHLELNRQGGYDRSGELRLGLGQ